MGPISYFDLWHEAQLRFYGGIPRSEYRAGKPNPVGFVILPEIQGDMNLYLKACVGILKDLRAADPRVVLVDLPRGLSALEETDGDLVQLLTFKY